MDWRGQLPSHSQELPQVVQMSRNTSQNLLEKIGNYSTIQKINKLVYRVRKCSVISIINNKLQILTHRQLLLFPRHLIWRAAQQISKTMPKLSTTRSFNSRVNNKICRMARSLAVKSRARTLTPWSRNFWKIGPLPSQYLLHRMVDHSLPMAPKYNMCLEVGVVNHCHQPHRVVSNLKINYKSTKRHW